MIRMTTGEHIAIVLVLIVLLLAGCAEVRDLAHLGMPMSEPRK